MYHLGSNYKNHRSDLDIAIKKVSPVEQLLIYQSCYICIPVKVFTRDAWRRLKLICGAWISQKGERHSWIYEAMWGVICLLIYAWPVNFFFHFVKTSGIPRNLVHKKRHLKVSLSQTWWGIFYERCPSTIGDVDVHLQSLWRRADARNVSLFTLYGGQFTF